MGPRQDTHGTLGPDQREGRGWPSHSLTQQYRVQYSSHTAQKHGKHFWIFLFEIFLFGIFLFGIFLFGIFLFGIFLFGFFFLDISFWIFLFGFFFLIFFFKKVLKDSFDRLQPVQPVQRTNEPTNQQRQAVMGEYRSASKHVSKQASN